MFDGSGPAEIAGPTVLGLLACGVLHVLSDRTDDLKDSIHGASHRVEEEISASQMIDSQRRPALFLVSTPQIGKAKQMCGRYTLRTPAAQLIDIFHTPAFPMLAPRYNIAPTQLVICVRSVADEPNSREAVLMRWGLIPFWAKDMTIGNQLINARAETVAEKPSFRNAFAKRRCLIPADGFFEWQKLSTGKKQPWLIERNDGQPFAMAGLWECWTPKTSPDENRNDADDAESNRVEPVISCTILTTAANDDMKPLHDRMPVILPIEAWSTWLHPSSSKGQLSGLLTSQPNGQLTRTCVSTVVNRPYPDNVDCITPVLPPEPLAHEIAPADSTSTLRRSRVSKRRTLDNDGVQN